MGPCPAGVHGVTHLGTPALEGLVGPRVREVVETRVPGPLCAVVCLLIRRVLVACLLCRLPSVALAASLPTGSSTGRPYTYVLKAV